MTTTRTILVLLTSQKLGQAKAMDCCVCLHWPLPQTKCQVTWLAMQGARSFFCGDSSRCDNFPFQVTYKAGVKCVQQTLKAIFAQMSSSVIGKKNNGNLLPLGILCLDVLRKAWLDQSILSAHERHPTLQFVLIIFIIILTLK